MGQTSTNVYRRQNDSESEASHFSHRKSCWFTFTSYNLLLISDSINTSMAQMALSSFPYYFTIPNSEICTANFGIRNCEVYVVWASGNS